MSLLIVLLQPAIYSLRMSSEYNEYGDVNMFLNKVEWIIETD